MGVYGISGRTAGVTVGLLGDSEFELEMRTQNTQPRSPKPMHVQLMHLGDHSLSHYDSTITEAFPRKTSPQA